MMKALSIGMGGAVLLALAAGCQPQLAETGMGDAELQWYSYVSESYPSFRPPRTAAQATQDKYTTLSSDGQQPVAEAGAGELVAEEDEIVITENETPAQSQLEAAADDPTGTVEDGIVLEPEEDEALPKPVAAPETELKAAGQEKSAVEQKYTEYVVRPGDTLSGIAKKFYKDGRLFGRIYEANKDVIPNPNKLPLGAKIRIPQP